MRTAWLLSAAALAAFSCIAACILVVDSPSEVFARCRFGGEETTCGKCIRAKCQAEVNGCCDVESCQASMTHVDQCAQGDDAGCAELAEGAAAPVQARAVSTCLVTKCSAECPSVAR